MGTTADKLEYLQGTKAAIKSAIINKGVAVPDGTTFRGYAERIDEIMTGSNVEVHIGTLYSARWNSTPGQYVNPNQLPEFAQADNCVFLLCAADEEDKLKWEGTEISFVATSSNINFFAPRKVYFDLDYLLIKIPAENEFACINIVDTFPKNTKSMSYGSVVASSIVSKSVPAGRILGDANGDGAVDSSDIDTINRIIIGSITPDNTQKAASDISGNGSVDITDTALLSEHIFDGTPLGQWSHDVLNVWAVNPSYSTEDGQFYIDVTDSDVAVGSDLVVVLGGNEGTRVTKVVPSNGSFRVYMTVPPIEPMPYKIIGS